MVLSMVRPYQHPKTKMWWVRKVVPAELRAAVGKRELKASLRTKDPEAAKAAIRPVLDRFDAIIGSARVKAAGVARVMSLREIAGVLGVAYREMIARYADDPGSPEAWDERASYYAEMFQPDSDDEHGPRSFVSDRFIREEVKGIFEAQGVIADPETLRRAAEMWAREQFNLAVEMEKRSQGDWSGTLGVDRLPKIATEAREPVLIDDLLKGWAAETGKTGKALYDRERTVAAFKKHLTHGDASRVTAKDVVAFKEARLAAGVSTKTVANDLNELSPLWKWGKSNQKLAFTENPFAGVAPLKRVTSEAAREPYTDEEARRLLEAARGQSGLLRWLPWLLCFTAGRLGEIVQSHKEDFAPISGVPGGWALHIHANGPGRSLKNPQSRRYVPLHPALIAEGFLDYLNDLPKGSPLFPDVGLDKFGTRKGRAGNVHSRWVRNVVGITDTRKDPAHAWRHLFEDRARRARVPQNATDALMGHKNAANESEGYGRGFRFMPETTAPHVASMSNPSDPPAG